ncbi:DJ-1/PfpI family protein [Mesorhizobium sp. LjNodule214]|uniref:DJ-1/PfpI family protein n=1 Tax=Mesorhizobium sp. LjNodule214 TaxID=3342252 RepID=UPI003ED03976
MPGKKILMLTGDFTEEYEIFVYQQAMEAVGHTVHVVCPDKSAGDMIKTSLHDFEGDQTYTEKPGHNALINKTFSEAEKQLAQYDAVYCAGGRGPEYIRTDKRVQAMVRHFHDAKKPIFTICHGVQILIAVDGVVRGKKVAALAACEPEVTLAGGTYIDLSPTDAYVDGTLVSAKGWTALAAFIRECLKVLGTEIRHA